MLIPLGDELPASCCLTSLALITDPTAGSTLLDESLLFLALEVAVVKLEAEVGGTGLTGLSEEVLLLLALPILLLTPLLKTWVTLSMTLPVIKINFYFITQVSQCGNLENQMLFWCP